jgi:hypothetical protein
MAEKAWGDDIPSKLESSDEEEEEQGEVIASPPSLPHETFPSFDDILSRQVEVVAEQRLGRQSAYTT